ARARGRTGERPGPGDGRGVVATCRAVVAAAACATSGVPAARGRGASHGPRAGRATAGRATAGRATAGRATAGRATAGTARPGGDAARADVRRPRADARPRAAGPSGRGCATVADAKAPAGGAGRTGQRRHL